ncbi:MAG: hypothetical protein A2Y10_19215 [Planctomycetes bacterium GWF2_41_51]|nr:MAG: hypothetical protein A2Y10_19215 [Planctomycetes bacterium GWF2_41_51]HBG27726.1 hypothetical protein [Phycisphaerales bacterium]
MKKVLLFLLLIFTSKYCLASDPPFKINTVNDALILPTSVLLEGSIHIGDTKQGVFAFPTSQITKPVANATLSISSYASKVLLTEIGVYGYENSDNSITLSDYNAGTFIGIWDIPPNLSYGKDIFFDVTPFLQGADSSFVKFNLRGVSGSLGAFCSLDSNLGHPSQLTVTLVPEPTTIALMLLGGSLIRKRA